MGDLDGRFERWVEDVVRAERFWIVINATEQNTVLEDPDADRDLQELFATEAEAQAHSERPADAGKGLRPDWIETDALRGLCDAAERRGDAFALWSGTSWIAAEPDLLREELERYVVE